MPNPRTPIELLKLAGSPNLKRALNYQKKDAQGKPPTGDYTTVIENLRGLLDQSIKSARRGNIRHKKSNPSFQHIKILIEAIQLLSGVSAPVTKSDREVIAEAERMLGLTPTEAN